MHSVQAGVQGFSCIQGKGQTILTLFFFSYLLYLIQLYLIQLFLIQFTLKLNWNSKKFIFENMLICGKRKTNMVHLQYYLQAVTKSTFDIVYISFLLYIF